MKRRTFDKQKHIDRLAVLTAERDAILAVSTPLREARDAFAAEAGAQERAMNAELKEAEKDIGAIAQEIAFLTRAVGHMRSVPDAASAGETPAGE